MNGNFHLLMFLHPGCSCSQASLAELSRIMGRKDNVTAQIVFMKTKKLNSLLANNELIKKARLLPRTKLIFDEDGVEAQMFGALTSGQTFLYHSTRGLLFSGGLTAARGHEGKSLGSESIEQLLNHKPSRNIASVFGCDMFGKLIATGK